MPPSTEVDEDELQIAQEIRVKFFEEYGNNLSHFDDQDLERIKQDDEYLCRFVRHRKKDMEKAFEMMVSCLKWRKIFRINDLTERSIDRRLFESGFLFHHNFDKEGHPMLVFLGKLHKKDPQQHSELKRFVAFGLERMAKQYPGQRVTLIFDMQETGLANMDMEFVRFIINCFNNYFPCMLAWLIVLEMPWILSAAWKLVKTWLPPEGISKIKFVNKTEITQYIATDQLLIKHGGTDRFEYTYPPSPYEAATPPPVLNNADLGVNNGIHDAKESLDDVGESTESKKVVRFSSAEDGIVISGNPGLQDDDDDDDDRSSMQLKLRNRGASSKRQSNPSEATTSKPSLLTFSPSDELIFIGRKSSSAEIQQSFTVTNNTEGIVAFKVKTTSPESYRVRPSSGSILPGSSVEINVFLQPGHAASVHNDKFLVMSTSVESKDLTSGQLSTLWKSLSKSCISEHRLRCKYAAASSQSMNKDVKPQDDNTNEAINSLKLTLIDIERKVDTANIAIGRLEQKLETTYKLQIALMTVMILFISILLYSLKDKSKSLSGMGFGFLTNSTFNANSQLLTVFIIVYVVMSALM